MNLSNEQVNALLERAQVPDSSSQPDLNHSEFSAASADPTPDAFKAVNLVNQEKFIELRMRGLELIHERFSRSLRTDLFSTLRRAIDVDFIGTSFLKYKELMQSRSSLSSFNIVQIKPLRGSSIFIFSSKLIYSFVECLFGGDGRFSLENRARDFSQTEQRIIFRIIEIIFSCYTKSAQSTIALQFEYLRTESNPEFVNIADPDEMMMISSFNLKVANILGEMRICMPWKSLEPLRHILDSTSESTDGEMDEIWKNLLAEQIKQVEVELIASLNAARLTVSEVLSLKVGDFIQIPNTDNIKVTVDEMPVLDARCGTHNGSYALEVKKLLNLSKIS